MQRVSVFRWSITRLAWSTALVLSALIALTAASARADSLVYVKGGDIWRSAPDGAQAQRLTSGGDYASPSQADDGTILATDQSSGVSCRRQIVRLSPAGKILVRLDVLGPVSSSLTALGPWYPQVSPDGRRVAFGETVIDSDTWSAICEGGLSQPLDHVKVANAQTGAAIGLISPHASLWTPSWMPDGRVLVFAPYSVTAAQVGYGNAGQGPLGWFSDPKEDPNAFPPRQYISDGEISRDGSQIAYIRGENTIAPRELPTIEVASIAGLSTPPAVRCDIPVPRPPAENPTWSPDGKSLAWSDQDGIHVTQIAPGTGACGASPRLVVPGGLHPDWGPYSGSGTSTPGLRVVVAKSVTRTTLLRSGITARVTCSHACRIDSQLIVATPRATIIWRGTARLRRAGTAKIHIQLKKTTNLRVKRGGKLQLRVQARPGGTSTTTIRVR